MNSVKRSTRATGGLVSSIDRVYTSSSSPQCERNPPQGGALPTIKVPTSLVQGPTSLVQVPTTTTNSTQV